MCGIYLTVEYIDGSDQSGNAYSYIDSVKQELVQRIADRGPSASNKYSVELDNCILTFFSSVLSLRKPFDTQPHVGDIGILQFNGELYNSEIEHNDTQWLWKQISSRGVAATLRALRGECAFVYYDVKSSLVWFARDCIGRRSLVKGMYGDGHRRGIFISSVAPDPRSDNFNVQEVEARGLYTYNVKTREWKTYAEWSFDPDSALCFPYRSLSNDVIVPDLVSVSKQFENIFELAIKKRVLNIPHFEIGMDGTEKTLAILFSGGIDCTLVAHFADRVLPDDSSIDLLNVSFENLRKKEGWDTPDRKLGRRSWKELRDCSCKSGSYRSRFRFVEINIPYEEMAAHRDTVQRLMWPKNGVMDLSIAIAFYFASRGQGTAIDEDGTRTENYSTPSRVLVSGLGADELFAGYTRHWSSLQQGGYDQFAQELQLDFSRLDTRNLGRDDRICCSWGKEIRYPFLDEDVVDWAMGIPLGAKLYQEKTGQVHTKYILRLVAERARLGLVSKELKRAIQFGARSAKMEVNSGKLSGHDVLDDLKGLQDVDLHTSRV